ncbi:MAG: hypothetical protein B7Z82_07870 [Halothiobacillus sp. 20-54-6]|nr:MAG: hypothetical protein B7Z82_07870 [Halothiobacillus sp. 20-54-6]
MSQYWLIGISGVALFFALVSIIAVTRLAASVKTHSSNARWLQAQLERIENEQGSIESALAGLGRHMDGFDQKITLQAQRLEHIETRLVSATNADDSERGFSHAVRLSTQGRVTLQELVNDFGLSESEAQLLLRINQPKSV